MQVSAKQMFQRQLIVSDESTQFFLLIFAVTTAINQNRFACFIVQHISIFLKKVKFK
jgi:hypothetical protein